MPRRPSRFDETFTRSDTYDETAAYDESPGIGAADAHSVVPERITSPEGEPLPDSAPSQQREPLSDDDLLTVVGAELDQTAARYSGELAENRIVALRYYEGRMAPPKVAGRSTAVSTDVADVIEWTLPQVISALADNENVVLFDAESEEDKEQAQLETDACEYVLYKENDGFLYVYSAVKDALLQKNGIGKVYWDESTTVEYEDYEGLLEDELVTLLNPEDGTRVEPVEWSETVQTVAGMDGQPVQVAIYDVQVKRFRSNGGVKVVPVPPEEFSVNRDHNSIMLDDARFTVHMRIPTASDLISEGWPEDLVETLPTYSVDDTGEREERRSLDDEKDFGQDPADESMRRIMVNECYVRVDRDRDGYAELLQVTVAGQGGYSMMGWEHATCNPFVGTTGILLTHKFYGKSLFDRCKEIQDQKTALVRQIQDNLRAQNDSRLLVVAGQVNLDDLLTSRPGGIVRQRQPGMVEPLVAPQIGELGYRHLEYLDNVRTGRAGVSPDTASVAEAIAGDTAHGLERLMSAKEELTGLMIRLFANTLCKATLVKVRALLQRYRKTPMHFEVRGQWQEVNPAEWTRRTGATVKGQLSIGDRTKRLNGLQAVIQQQQAVVENGGMGTLVTEKNIYNSLTEFVRATHVGDPTPYWTDPESEEAQAARAQAEQEEQAQQQMAMQQQQLMIQATAAIEGQKEMTKRMQIQQDAIDEQSKRMADMQKHLDEMTRDYTKMELEYKTDVPGEGMEGGASDAVSGPDAE